MSATPPRSSNAKTRKLYSALCRAVQDGILLPELPNFMQFYTWRNVHIICMSSACHLHAHVICMSSTPACHPHLHVICTCMSSACYTDTSSAHTHVIHTSSAALLMVNMDLNYLSTLTGSGY